MTTTTAQMICKYYTYCTNNTVIQCNTNDANDSHEYCTNNTTNTTTVQIQLLHKYNCKYCTYCTNYNMIKIKRNTNNKNDNYEYNYCAPYKYTHSGSIGGIQP